MQLNITMLLKRSLMVLVFAGLTACGGGSDDEGRSDDEGGGDSPTYPNNPGGGDQWLEPEPAPDADLAQRIHKLGIAGAQGFVITGANGEAGSGARKMSAPEASIRLLAADSSTGQALESNTLYKVTEGGRLEPVSFSDKTGNELERGAIQPVGIVEVGPDFVYMVITVKYSWRSPETLGLLVNKSTGLAFLAGDALGEPYNFTGGDTRSLNSQFRFDNAGNIYLLRGYSDRGYRTLPTKVDISNLGYGNLTSAPLQTLHHTQGFEVSGNGEIMAYSGHDANDNYGHYVYDAATSGTPRLSSLEGLPADADQNNLFLGLDGELYITAGKDLWSFGRGIETLYHLNKEAGSITATELGPVTLKTTSGAVLFEDPFERLTETGWYISSTRRVVNGLLIYTPEFSYSKYFYEVDIQNRTIVNHDKVMEPFDNSKSFDFYSTDRHLWIHGTAEAIGAPLVVRYNPVTQESDTLAFDANFELHRIEPVGEDRVMFEGIQLTGPNGTTKIVGQMDAHGNILEQTVYATARAPVTVLHAITPADFISIDGNPNDWNTGLRILNGAKTDGLDGDDLLFYSETRGSGDYKGLVEFNGSISTNHNHHTRIIFDTHTINISRNGVWVTKGNETPVDALAKGGSVAQGQAVEFAIPAELLGEGANPVLKSVERFTAALEDSVDDWTYEWINTSSGSDYELQIGLTLKAPLSGPPLTITLTEGYQLIVTENDVTLVAGSGPGVSFSVTGSSFTIPEAAFNSANPTTIKLEEKILDSL